MQRQRGELVPIGEVLSGLDDVPAIRDASPQARHCFTLADQVNQLVSALWAFRVSVGRRSQRRGVSVISACPYRSWGRGRMGRLI